MAVFRVEKTKDFTIMCNHHLRNRKLSLKAKGLLSLMLSLPEDWDYTTKGLAHICKDGIDAISTALKELEQQGYLTRERIRLTNGRLGDIEYTIHEQPVTPDIPPNSPKRENPRQVNPGQAFPVRLYYTVAAQLCFTFVLPGRKLKRNSGLAWSQHNRYNSQYLHASGRE